MKVCVPLSLMVAPAQRSQFSVQKHRHPQPAPPAASSVCLCLLTIPSLKKAAGGIKIAAWRTEPEPSREPDPDQQQSHRSQREWVWACRGLPSSPIKPLKFGVVDNTHAICGTLTLVNCHAHLRDHRRKRMEDGGKQQKIQQQPGQNQTWLKEKAQNKAQRARGGGRGLARPPARVDGSSIYIWGETQKQAPHLQQSHG